jgi:hypothetical protein
VPRTVRSVVSRPGGLREVSDLVDPAGQGHTSTTLVALQDDALVDQWENQGVPVHGLRADGRAWFKILTAPPVNPTGGDLWIERLALNNTVVRFHDGSQIITLAGSEAPGFTVDASEAILLGHALCGHAGGAQYAQAVDTAEHLYRVIGLAAQELVGAGSLQVLTRGDTMELPDWSVVAGTALLVPGAKYFLGDTPGRLLDDVTGLQVAAAVGIAVEPTRLQITLDPPVMLQ